MEKLIKSLNEVDLFKAWRISDQIVSRCIINAKSNLAKQRLVQAAVV